VGSPKPEAAKPRRAAIETLSFAVGFSPLKKIKEIRNKE
jgi:hypothetical protein